MQYGQKNISFKTIYAHVSKAVLSILISIRLDTFETFQISYKDLEVMKNGPFSLVIVSMR